MMFLPLAGLVLQSRLSSSRDLAPLPPPGFEVTIRELTGENGGRLEVTFRNRSDGPIVLHGGDEGSFYRVWAFDEASGAEPPLTAVGKKLRAAFKNYLSRDHNEIIPVLPNHQFSFTEWYRPGELYNLDPSRYYVVVFEWWEQGPGGISVVSKPIPYNPALAKT